MSSLGNKKVFARNLNQQMNKRGIDRVQLCENLGFKYSTVSEWLSAKKYPRIDKIEMLAEYFGISKSALIEEKQVSDPAPEISETVLRIAQKQGVTPEFILKVVEETPGDCLRVADGAADTSSDRLHYCYVTDHEYSVLYAYREHPEMQPAVDKILGIDKKP